MRGCTVGGGPLSGDASGRGDNEREGCRAASATTGARTRRGGMRWRVHGAALVVARRDAPPGLTWRRVDIGGRLVRRCRSPSIMAARHISVRGMRRSRHGLHTVTHHTHIMRMHTSTPMLIIYNMRSTLPRVPCTVPSGSRRRSTALHIHRFVTQWSFQLKSLKSKRKKC